MDLVKKLEKLAAEQAKIEAKIEAQRRAHDSVAIDVFKQLLQTPQALSLARRIGDSLPTRKQRAFIEWLSANSVAVDSDAQSPVFSQKQDAGSVLVDENGAHSAQGLNRNDG